MKKKKDEHELRRCPFCGGKAKLVDYGQEGVFEDWDIECEKCHILLVAPGAEDGAVTTKGEATKAWNRREFYPIATIGG